MSKVIFDMSMSLDGYVKAVGSTPDEPLGRGGERLHEWAMGGGTRDGELLAAATAEAGAYIGGRRTYDDSLRWWGADGPTGPARLPLFVLTHRAPDDAPENGVYTFVTDGVESALRQAREAAGGKSVYVMGGPDIGSSSSGPAWSTRSAFTWCPCSSAEAPGSSTTSGTATCGSNGSAWSTRRRPSTSSTTS